MRNLTETHCNALNKVAGKLRLRQKMNHSQLILNNPINIDLVDKAEKLINEAIILLKQVN